MTSTVDAGPRATERGLALVRVVAAHPDGISLADAARAVDLTASTALRQLRSLEAAGFAERRADGRYVPGDELLRLARTLAASATLPRLAAGVLADLAASTGESAYLAEATDADTVVYTAMTPGRHAVRHVGYLGHRVTRHGTAVGDALAGVIDADGVAVRFDGAEAGVSAVSAPVVDTAGRIIAAVSVVGPTYRLTDGVLTTARAAVGAAARTLSSSLDVR
ncbi:MAG: IclR family transcriptional regulator [Ilumatobacteraceae bacterium]